MATAESLAISLLSQAPPSFPPFESSSWLVDMDLSIWGLILCFLREGGCTRGEECQLI